MFSVFAGTFLLAMVHALIPNHWLPLVAVSRAERWSRRELISMAFFAALAHVSGTILLGWILGVMGKRLQEQYGSIIFIITSIVLVIFGLIYFTVNLPHHHHQENQDVSAFKRSRRKWLLIFVLMMFLSPCLEVESLFLSAGAYGTTILALNSVVYAIISICGILLLVQLGFKGIDLLPAQFIEHNEKKISGLILIAVGILNFFLH